MHHIDVLIEADRKMCYDVKNDHEEASAWQIHRYWKKRAPLRWKI